MLVTALTLGTLTHRVRLPPSRRGIGSGRTQTLLALSREVAAAPTTDEIAQATVRHVSQVLETRALVLLTESGRQAHLSKPTAAALSPLDAKEMSVAQWASEHGQIAGAGTNTLPAAAGTYVPMKTSRGSTGVLGIFPEDRESNGIRNSGKWWRRSPRKPALAIERATLAEEARQAWERVEAEFLRNTLLSGVSHELRTPLAAITGAASTLIETGNSLSASAKQEMLDTISSEADRMERLITNLLDMTRLESGGLTIRREWHPLAEVVGSALHHLDRRLRGRAVRTDIPGRICRCFTSTAWRSSRCWST